MFKYIYLKLQDTFIDKAMQICFFSIGKLIANYYLQKNTSGLYLFLPNYYLTGSNKVNLDILLAVKELKPTVVMCGKSEDDFYLKDFEKNAGEFFNISNYTSNPTVRYLMYGYWSEILNRQKSEVVYFGSGQLFYEFLEYLDPNIMAIDLIHALDEDNKKYFFEQVSKLDKRIIINNETKEQMIDEYRQKGIDRKHDKKLQVIYNGVQIPEKTERDYNRDMTLLFVGRDSPVKRVHLVGKIATKCVKRNLPVKVELVGDMEHVVDKKDQVNCSFSGKSDDVSRHYRNADVLLLTSSLEGFPLVVMEAMAYGVVPICTDVGGIKDHIQNDENGFIVENSNEEKIITDFVEKIELLILQSDKLKSMSEASYTYAKEHFSMERFKREYLELFKSYL